MSDDDERRITEEAARRAAQELDPDVIAAEYDEFVKCLRGAAAEEEGT